MKRVLIITGAVALIVALGALWLYMLVIGTPRADDDSNPFDFGRAGGEPLPEPPPVVATTTAVGATVPPLRQLTTRVVAGFRDVQVNASSSPQVYFVESGTGHLYRITDNNGTEERLSGITIAETLSADISPDGQTAIIQSGYGNNLTATIISLGSATGSTPRLTTIPGDIHHTEITNDGELLYAVRDAKTTFTARNLRTGTTKTLFSVPFRSALVSWGNTADGPHYVYPKPSYYLEGYVYRWQKSKLDRLPIEGYGLVAVGSGDLVGFSRTEGESYVSGLFDSKTRTQTPPLFTILPEKCDATSDGGFWCASPTTLPGFGFPDSWYRGDTSLTDILVYFENTPDFQATEFDINPSETAGRPIDVGDLKVGVINDRVLFTNKLDASLWLYERP